MNRAHVFNRVADLIETQPQLFGVGGLAKTVDGVTLHDLYDPKAVCHCAIGLILKEIGHSGVVPGYNDGGNEIDDPDEVVVPELGLTQDEFTRIWETNDRCRYDQRPIVRLLRELALKPC